MSDILTASDLASRWQCSLSKAYVIMHELPTIRLARATVRVRLADVEEYERKCTVSPDRKSTASKPRRGMLSGRQAGEVIALRRAQRTG